MTESTTDDPVHPNYVARVLLKYGLWRGESAESWRWAEAEFRRGRAEARRELEELERRRAARKARREQREWERA